MSIVYNYIALYVVLHVCIFRITSQHNATVIEKIKGSVKGDYSDDVIKSNYLQLICNCFSVM